MEALFEQGYFALFVIVTLGLIVGKIKIKGFSFDLSAVIFVALIFGHFGILVPKEFQTIGLLFFIFTIGMQSGPGFFDAFLKYGRSQILICAILIISGGTLTWGAMTLFDIDTNIAVGIFNGALTSTPGLAAAIDATGSSEAAVGYGIAYPLGVIGVILLIQLLPVLFRKNLKNEELALEQENSQEHPELLNKNFVIENPNIDGKSLSEIGLSNMTRATISRIKHNEEIFTPKKDTHLYIGDIVKLVGDEEALEKGGIILGKETDEKIKLSGQYKVNWLLVTNKEVVSKSIKELNLRAYDATVTRIRRSGIDISPKPNSKIRFGDKLMVVAEKDNMNHVMTLLGNEEKRLSETNFLPIALGIIIGVLIGGISVPLFGLFDFRLGITGGVLTAALVLSRIGKTGPIIWSMSGSANQLLRQLGLLFFMAAVGTSAGEHLVETIQEKGVLLIAVGAVITVVPMLITAWVGSSLFKTNFITLLGVLSGSMTSTPGLAAIDSKTESDAASVGYATVYPAALVLMIIISQILAII
jgi:putative transport protein